MERPPFVWFFVGANFSDVPAAATELEKLLGLDAIQVLDDWAMLSSHWLDPRWPTWEIERRSDRLDSRPAPRQPIGFHVSGDVLAPREVVGPDGVRLMRVPHVESEGACPVVSRVELQASNMEAMKGFYIGVLGLTGAPDEQGIALQSPFRSALVLVPTTEERRPPPPATLAEAPTYLGFQTPDIDAALRWLEAHEVPILRRPKLRRWVGTDIVVADPDGNPVWIAKDHIPHRVRRFHHAWIFGGRNRECRPAHATHTPDQ